MAIFPFRDHTTTRTALVLAIAAGLAVAASPAAAQPGGGAGIRLEGSGKHRADCDAMQLKPFDAGVWGHLTSWSGEAPTAESTKDKVVLLVTFAGWNKQTHHAAQLADRLHKEHGAQGLVVAGIHNPSDFASATKAAADLSLSFPFAADKDGKARAALNVDGDPDFYLIDRAGNMRFADVQTSSVERAVGVLLAETPEAAAAVPGAVTQTARQKALDMAKTGDTKGLVKPGQPLTVTFTDPTEEAYAKAAWPRMVEKTGISEIDQMLDKIRNDKPTIELPSEGWLTPAPVSRGRIVAIYMVDPLKQDFRGQIPLMNRLQDAYTRDLVVVGVPLAQDNTSSSMTEDEKKKAEERAAEVFAGLKKTEFINHGWANSPLKAQNLDKWYSFAKSGRERGIVVLASTDGRIHWVGNPHLETFHDAVKQMVRADPAVQARRKAEEAKAMAEGR